MDQVISVSKMYVIYVVNENDVFWAIHILKTAYDMQRLFGVGKKLLKAVPSFYVDCMSCVRVEMDASELLKMYMDGVENEVNGGSLLRRLELVGAML